jgi:hypothetical protein
MLSVACHEAPAPAAEAVPSAASLRRIAVAFAPERRPLTDERRARRDLPAVVSIPRFSRIVFRAGNVSVR